jgi:hypothetical protein
MSYNSDGVFTAGTCLDKIQQLADIRGDQFSPMMKRSKLGYLEGLTSPLNMQGAQITPQEGSKNRTVLVRWRQRTIQSRVDSTRSGTCTSTDYPDFNEEYVSLSKDIEYKFALNTSEFKKVCEGRSKFLEDTLALSFDAMARDINQALLTEQLTNFGINIATGDSDSQSITVFPAATGAPNASALQTLLADYDLDNEFTGSPMIIGGGNIYRFWKTLEQSCCNDGGVNMLELSNSIGYSPFADTMVDGVIGANEFIVMEPTSTQFLTFNDYVGEDVTSSGTSVARGTVRDPKTGILYDIKVLQDDCSDDWVVKLNLTYDIWYQPLDTYHFDDHLYGTNGTLRYTAATS